MTLTSEEQIENFKSILRKYGIKLTLASHEEIVVHVEYNNEVILDCEIGWFDSDE